MMDLAESFCEKTRPEFPLAAPRRSAVDLLADYLVAYGECRQAEPQPQMHLRARPTPFSGLMRTAGLVHTGGADAEVV